MIFAGTFTDPDGKPWDLQTKVLQTWPGGGMGSVRRHGINPHPGHAPFVAAVRYSLDRWRNALDEWDRDGWETIAEQGPSRRGNLARTPTHGWITFNAYDFVQLYADPPSEVLGPSETSRTILSTAIDSVDLVNQTVTFTATADVGIAAWLYTRLATFQIEPRAVRYRNPWRATRLIDLAVAGDLDPGPYNPTVPLRWPVSAGENLRLYWRGRVASWWKYEADDTFVT